MLLEFTSYAPQKPSVVVINGIVANTGYALIADGLDFGNAAFDVAYSGPRGTQGSLPAIGVAQNRAAVFPIRVLNSGSKDVMLQNLARLIEIADDMRRFGGEILWQSASQTYRQIFKVLTCGWGGTDWNQRTETNYVVQNTLNVVAAPYLLGDPMDTHDTFDTNSIGDYTLDAGTACTVAGGKLVPGSTGTLRYRHTVKGYSHGDVQVTQKVTTGATITNGVWGVTRFDSAGADTGIAAEILAGTNVLRLALYSAGTAGTTFTTAFTPAASTTYWVRIRFEGNRAIAEVFTSTPTPTATPAATVTATLTTAQAGKYPLGQPGFRHTVAGTDERYDDFTVEPYTYRLVNAPEQIRLNGQIPGDVPATADLTVTPVGGSQVPIWGLASWLERPIVPNLCWNGDFESSVFGAGGWSNAAISGVIGAATNGTIDSTAGRVKFGANDLQVNCPATTDTGVSFQIVRRFKQGRTYAALLWASAGSATTAARIKLGVSGDLATGTAAALSTTPKVYSVVWTPSTDENSAYVAFGINAATATAMNIDGVVVVEVPTITLSAAISTTSGPTTFTVYATPSETPNLMPDGTLNAPFHVMIDQEIIRVTAITGPSWTGDRAVEGSVGATHAQDAPLIILPPLRPHFEGKGALPTYGFIEGDGDVQGLSSAGAGTFTRQTTDANARGGTVNRWTPGTSGSQLATLIYMVDPNTLVPDDYTLGELDVEVWVRELWASSLTNMRVMISAQPEGGSTFGAERYSREFGNVGKLIQPANAKVARIHRLGSLPMIVDRSNPQRWRLKLTLACTGGSTPTWDVDYLLLIPTRGRLASPTGEVNDTASAAATFPAFIPYDAGWGSTSAMSKTLRSDGSSLIAAPGQNAYPDAGLGDVVEVPDGDCDLIVKLSPLVPDDPTLDSTAETAATLTTCCHLAVVPRYAYGRGI